MGNVQECNLVTHPRGELVHVLQVGIVQNQGKFLIREPRAEIEWPACAVHDRVRNPPERHIRGLLTVTAGKVLEVIDLDDRDSEPTRFTHGLPPHTLQMRTEHSPIGNPCECVTPRKDVHDFPFQEARARSVLESVAAVCTGDIGESQHGELVSEPLRRELVRKPEQQVTEQQW